MYAEEIQPYLENYYNTLGKSKILDLIQHATNGGKCIRGFIVKHIIETLTKKTGKDIPWQPIAAVELVHSASIVIDDLPCMDNDEIRRGKKSTFKQFGNNEALLSSFFMISETTRILVDGLDEDCKLNEFKPLIAEYCELLGKNLVVGQYLDLKGDAESFFNIKFPKEESRNYYIMKYKTCSLFSFSFLLGGYFANVTDKEKTQDFKNMGLYFGLMFQIVDDYKDKNTDVPYANYILVEGISKAIEKYQQARACLIVLLIKHKLFTQKFNELIVSIDKLFA